MKRICALLLVLCCCCSGCWDYTDVTMQNYVTGVGIDRLAAGGYRVSIELQNLSEGSANRVVESTGAGVFDAIRNAMSHAGKKLYWGHCSLIVIGETITDDSFLEVLDVFNRAQDVYLNTSLAMIRGASAADLFHTKLDTTVTAHLMHIFENESSTRRFQKISLWELPRSVDACGGYLLPVVTLSEDRPAVSGSAIFRKTTCLGFLSGQETLLYSLLTNSQDGGFLDQISYDTNHSVSFGILGNHNKITRSENSVSIAPTVIVSLSGTNDALDLADQNKRFSLESTVAASLEVGFRKLWQRACAEGFSDLFQLADKATPVQFSVTVKLGNMGVYRNPANWEV